MKTVCVYCSSSNQLEEKYYAMATALGSELGTRGLTLVYGGGKTGLMGTIARATKATGGKVVGVIPEFMKVRELAFDEADELVTVVTMRERKMLMETRAEAFVALPGGWGTLEEVMEILTLRQLDVLRRPVVFINQDGYYDELLRFFDKMLAQKFSKRSNRDLYGVARDVEELFAYLESWQPNAADDKWYVR